LKHKRGPCLADKGNKELFNTYQAGDETVLLVNRLGNIPVVKGKNRFLAGVYALGELGPDIIDTFILDDGFQHWALRRDVDVLLIDATNPFGNHKLFPEGILREPMGSMKRADICVITKSDMENQDEKTRILQMIRQYNSETPVFMAYHKPVCLMQASGETSSLNTLDHKKIYVFAGIANPSYFTFMLKSLGADIVKFKKFRDHHQYSQHDIQKIQKEAEGLDILTTEKDLVKLREIEFPQNLYALKIIFSVENGFYDILFKKISHFAD
jgi:tetraacyldisaccharide 4'-kinase